MRHFLRSLRAVVVFVAMIPILTAPLDVSAQSSDPADSFSLFSLGLSLNAQPTIGQQSTLSLSATANQSVGETTYRLILPDHYAIAGGSPSSYTLTYGTDEWNDDELFVEWTTQPQTGVPQTFSVTLMPQTASGLYEELEAAASTTEFTPDGTGNDSIWVRVGGSGVSGSMATSRPPQAQLSSDSSLDVLGVGSGGSLESLGVQPVNAPQLPYDKPFHVGVMLSAPPQTNQAFVITLTLLNTVQEQLGYSAVLGLPSGWQLTSGSLTLTGTINPGNQASRQFSVMPNSIPTSWQVTLAITPSRVTQTSAPAYHNYLIAQPGISNGAGGSILGAQTQSLPWGVNSVAWPAQVTCLNCGNYDFDLSTRLSGHVRLDGPDRLYDAGDLYLKIYTIVPGAPARRSLVASVLTSDTGYWSVCVGYDWDIVLGSIQLELYSMDSAQGNPDSGHSIATLDLDHQNVPFMERSKIYPLPTQACDMYVFDWVIPEDAADPFFISTFISVDMRKFAQSEMSLSIHGTAGYPLHVFYPYPDEGTPPEGRGPTSRCGESCLINQVHAWRMDILSHEYGHHVHWAEAGNFGNTETFRCMLSLLV